ncbi:hypothetical protein J6590_026894 [Homalodisca vitripennis]|nr:hypothetical protein J6590_026894 [Homalodisca vitripennis]
MCEKCVIRRVADCRQPDARRHSWRRAPPHTPKPQPNNNPPYLRWLIVDSLTPDVTHGRRCAADTTTA